MKKGCDVSTFQGAIDWREYGKGLDFAIIRAGFGRNNIDERAAENFKNARAAGVAVGGYWFSYALNVEDAAKEFDYLRAVAGETALPLFIDYEEESLAYAGREGVEVNPQEIVQAFLDRADKAGVNAGVYCNLNFYRKYFAGVIGPHPLWLAHWETKKPGADCAIWQYTNNFTAPGIGARCDCNYLMDDTLFPAVDIESPAVDIESLAIGVINGKYGNGNERKKKLGANYEPVQARVNEYYAVAKDVIKGLYGNGGIRKVNLKSAGYEPATVQAIVNAIL